MPTTYAHDLFGKMVYHRLNPEIQKKIKKYQTTYQIGLHGPDILFYVRPFHRNRFNQMAHRLHQEEAAGFFEKGRALYRQTGNEELAKDLTQDIFIQVLQKIAMFDPFFKVS